MREKILYGGCIFLLLIAATAAITALYENYQTYSDIRAMRMNNQMIADNIRKTSGAWLDKTCREYDTKVLHKH